MSAARAQRILIFFPFPPYPLRTSGVSIRYLPILSRLSRSHEVDVAVLASADFTEAAAEGLRPYCARLLEVPIPRQASSPPWMRYPKAARALLPWSARHFWTIGNGREIERFLQARLAGRDYDVKLAVGGSAASYLAGVPSRRFVVDFVDSPYLSLRRSVVGADLSRTRRAWEAWKTYRWEARLIQRADASIYASDVDAAAIAPTNASLGTRHVVPNGLSVEGYTAGVEPSVRSPSIGFLGNLGYPPNVEAVHWLHRRVFAPLRERIPELSLVIIGRAPGAAISALGRKPGVIVTGEVEDIWPWLNAVDVFAFPLLRGAGIKNKVLEAMYAGRSVVTTAIGAEGLGGSPGQDLEVCTGEDAFRSAVSRLLTDPAQRMRLGRAAHAFVSRRFAWGEIFQRFESALLGPREEPDEPWRVHEGTPSASSIPIGSGP